MHRFAQAFASMPAGICDTSGLEEKVDMLADHTNKRTGSRAVPPTTSKSHVRKRCRHA